MRTPVCTHIIHSLNYGRDIWMIFLSSGPIVTHNLFVHHLNKCMLDKVRNRGITRKSKLSWCHCYIRCRRQHYNFYTKPTDSHNYLDYRSAHPKHCKSNIPYNQFLRLKRICSKPGTFTQSCGKMLKQFIWAH